MCKRNCDTCAGYICEENYEICLKAIGLNSIGDECNDWFPLECPVTGMPFSNLVYEHDGSKTPVYSFSHYTSYTIPEYRKDDQEFIVKVYDEDEGCWSDECQSLCTLDEIKEEVSKEDFNRIKQFYNICE